MPNTGSAIVDTFLGSADEAAMRAAIGLDAIGNGESLGWADGKFTRAAANSLSLDASLTLAAVNGGGSLGTRTTGETVNAGTQLFDVGLRINTYDNADTEDPNYPYGSYSALDIDLRSTWFGGGDAIRIFTNEGGTRSKAAYFNSGGALYTRVGIVISGAYANYATNQGEDTTITAPTNDSCMLGIWGDVVGGIQTRAANVSNPWVWEGLDRNANKTSSILEDGSYWFGAGTTRASMDVGIKRVSAGLLEINSTTAGDYRDLILRKLNTSGLVTVGGGGASVPQLTFTPNSGVEMSFGMINGGSLLDWFNSGTVFGALGNGVFLRNDGQFLFGNSTNPNSTMDTGVGRVSAGIAKITDGSSGYGKLVFIVPTSDPGVTGALWNNAGTLSISA